MKPQVAEYLNFREYLRDFYTYQKQIKKHFSYRVWSKQIGVNSPSYFPDLIRGVKKIGAQKFDAVCESLQFSPSEKIRFKLLMEWEPQQSPEAEKKFLEEIKKQIGTVSVPLSNVQNRYFSKWFHPLLLEYLPGCSVGTELALLSHSKFNLTKTELLEGVLLLQELALLEVKNGVYCAVNTHVNKRDDGDRALALRWQKQMFLLGLEGMDWVDEKKLFNTVCVKLGEAEWAEAMAILREARDKILKLSETSEGKGKVCQWNSQLFPLVKDSL